MQDSIKPNDYACSMVALKRFAARLAFLCLWCGMGAAPLSRIGLLAATFAVICVVFSLLKKERLAGPALNHWDEALAFLMISHGAHILQKAAL